MTRNHDPRFEDPIEIFHVEDNPGDIRLIEEAFKSSAYETVIRPITNGAEAIDCLTNLPSRGSRSLPDLVLLDLNLPGEDGYSVLEAIRSHSELNNLPVIVLSGSSAGEDVRRCYGANANAYLTKPSDPDDFESLVESIEEFWFENVLRPPIPTEGS